MSLLKYSGRFYREQPQKNVEMQQLWKVMDDLATNAEDLSDSINAIIADINIINDNLIKRYGSFYDTTPSQVALFRDTPYPINIGITLISNGVSIVNGNEIRVNETRVYSLQYSIQFTNPDPNFHAVNVWLANNGTDIPDTNSRFSVPAKHGSINGSLIAVTTFLFEITPSDSIQLMWATSDEDVIIETIPATVFCPKTPGVILTVTNGNL